MANFTYGSTRNMSIGSAMRKPGESYSDVIVRLAEASEGA
jgi:hypothetical protein